MDEDGLAWVGRRRGQALSFFEVAFYFVYILRIWGNFGGISR